MDPRLNIIYARRSIRAFTGEPLAHNQIEELLHAAMAAPSARNIQPWEFIVITDPELKREVSIRHPNAKFAADAGAVFIVFGQPSGELFDQDLAAATENLLVAAAGLELGACWCGMPSDRQAPVRELVGLPATFKIGSVVAVGHPAEQKPPRSQYNPTKVFWERYGQRA